MTYTSQHISIMRRVFKVKIIISLGLLAVLLSAFFVFNEKILSSRSPKLLQQIILLIAPPKDYYSERLLAPIFISEANWHNKYPFKIKYTGKYDIGLAFSKYNTNDFFQATSKRYVTNLKMRLQIYENGVLAYTKEIGPYYDPFLARNLQGFSFAQFVSPSEVPVGKDLICEVQILTPDAYLAKKYDHASLCIQKLPDY